MPEKEFHNKGLVCQYYIFISFVLASGILKFVKYHFVCAFSIVSIAFKWRQAMQILWTPKDTWCLLKLLQEKFMNQRNNIKLLTILAIEALLFDRNKIGNFEKQICHRCDSFQFRVLILFKILQQLYVLQ